MEREKRYNSRMGRQKEGGTGGGKIFHGSNQLKLPFLGRREARGDDGGKRVGIIKKWEMLSWIWIETRGGGKRARRATLNKPEKVHPMEETDMFKGKSRDTSPNLRGGSKGAKVSAG